MADGRFVPDARATDAPSHTPARVHGGMNPISDAHRVRSIDLSTCVDAFGVLPRIEQVLSEVDANQAYRHYPDPDSRRARGRIAEFSAVPVDCVDVAPGAAESIWTLTRTVLRPNDWALVWKPCFSEFEHAVAAVGARLRAHTFGAGSTETEVARFFDAVSAHNPRLVYLCAPTCPRGQWVPGELLRRGMRKNPNTTFIIDQSYLQLSTHASELELRFPDNVVSLRSVTKELGLPGVRVGYAIANATLRAHMQTQRPYWSMGSHALAVLEAYVECQDALKKRRELVLARARELSVALTQLGLTVDLHDTHYFTVDVAGRPNVSATEVTAALLREGVAVRDCTSFGLPRRVRVVAHPEQRRLVEAWAKVCASDARGVAP